MAKRILRTTKFAWLESRRRVAQTFLSAGSGDFPVPSWRKTLFAGAVTLLILFSRTESRGTLMVRPLFHFNITNGAFCQSALTLGQDGNLYGTTHRGGDNNLGTIFRITHEGEHTVLFSFNGTNGSKPWAELVQDDDGAFYGTTTMEALSNGSVFRINSSGTLETLVMFQGTNGASPYGGLVKGQDGEFYGCTFSGGPYTNKFLSWAQPGLGTLFRISTNGTLTMLAAFDGTNGAGPGSTLLRSTDGNFYGTTYAGGVNNLGTIFKLTTNGTLTSLHSFSGFDGGHPWSSLIEATDGHLYGTATQGGSGYGTIFRYSREGTLTTLHAFNGNDGNHPRARLLQVNDNLFYGCANLGGNPMYDPNSLGTIFQITTNGEFTVLSHQNGARGNLPYAGMIKGTNGLYYGTTQGVNAFTGDAVVYRVEPAIAPTIQSLDLSGEYPVLTFSSVPGQVYIIQQTHELHSAHWMVAHVYTTKSTSISYTDRDDPTDSCYYRVVMVLP